MAVCVLVVAVARYAVVDGRAGRGTAGRDVEVVQTNADLSQRLTRLRDLSFGSPRLSGLPVIHVDDQARYQPVTGFGAAMTDTAAWLLYDRLSPAARARAMSDLFGAAGIHLNFLRLPIGASDFTYNRTPYSYDDLPLGGSDRRLLGFSVAHDEAYIVPVLRQMLAINPRVEILAMPWSPPAWMKANQSLDNRSNSGLLLGSMRATWARYFVKFIQAYARLGIRIAAVTPQNEPTNPTRYPGLDLESAHEARMITEFLRPALHRAGLRVGIYGGDVGWDARSAPSTRVIGGQVVNLQSGRAYVDSLVSGQGASSLDGVAWHCYYGSPDVMSRLHRMAPGLRQVVDECSPGIAPVTASELVISAMRNWASAVALWNLALDPRGGPVEPPNQGCPTCTGVLTVNERTRAVSSSHAYFELGQASEFVAPRARRIASEHFVSYDYKGPGTSYVTHGLDDVAFRNPNGSKVLVAYDNSPSSIRFAVAWRGHSFTYTLAPKATVTFVWDRPASARRSAL